MAFSGLMVGGCLQVCAWCLCWMRLGGRVGSHWQWLPMAVAAAAVMPCDAAVRRALCGAAWGAYD